jgi:hypothetical protein
VITFVGGSDSDQRIVLEANTLVNLTSSQLGREIKSSISGAKLQSCDISELTQMNLITKLFMDLGLVPEYLAEKMKG